MRLYLLAMLFASALAMQQPAAGVQLLASIRTGDATGTEQLLRSGVDVNARDGSGASPLMYAAAFGSEAAMRLLLSAGANVNAADHSGATALMWATHDATKVRVLLDRHADVNAVRADGTTPLLSAALRGETDIMRMLIAAGAMTGASAVPVPWRSTLPQIALTTNDPTMREFVERLGTAPPNVDEWTPPPFTRWILTSIYSSRSQRVPGDGPAVRALLDSGANPNEIVSQLTLTVPVLARVVRLGDPETVRALLDRGADPNLKGSRGLTPLMMAAATTADPTMVRLLLERGAAVAARDDAGNTALDWALTLGDTEAGGVLRKAGAISMTRPASRPKAVLHPRSARAAVDVAIERLQAADLGFTNKTRCISCHNQSLTAVAVKRAASKSATINRELATHPTAATLAVWGRSRENMLVGNCSILGFLGNVTYGLFGLAEEAVAATAETDAVTSCLSGLQKPDGSWEGGDTRPPLSGRSPLAYTALATRALKTYLPGGRRNEMLARTSRALDFLRRASPADTQEAAFKLLGLVWAGASGSDIATQVKRVLALQRSDGGWGQLPSMPSDAYATGQALYSLEVGGVASSSTSFRRGAEYLLNTQLDDGTWYVRSRAIGFQPYVDSGFPHGSDQFISAAATSWAVIGLSALQ